MRCARPLLAIAAAVSMSFTMLSTASARNLSLSSQTFRATFRELNFSSNFGSYFCMITLEGSFHSRTVSKVSGSLIGSITRAELGSCTFGSATILRETLPWHIRYRSFTGTLPAISSLVTDLVGFALSIREPNFGVTCLGRSTAETPARLTFLRESVGALTSASFGGETPFDCGFNISFSGASTSFTVLNSASRITLTLI